MAALLSLFNKPTIAWDFHSLMLGVQMMFSLMLSDTEKPIRICKHCLQTFMASRPRAIFCNPQLCTDRLVIVEVFFILYITNTLTLPTAKAGGFMVRR